MDPSKIEEAMLNPSKIEEAMLDLDQSSLDSPNPSAKAMRLFRYGRKMDWSQVKSYLDLFEQKDGIVPALAILLLGYYFSNRYNDNVSSAFLDQYASVLEWFIEHHPTSFIVWTARYPVADNNFKTLESAWLRHCDEAQTNLDVLNNAAHFCHGLSDDFAASLWMRAKELDPSLIWAYELAYLYCWRSADATSAKEKREFAEKALVEFSEIRGRLNDYPDRSYVTPDLMRSMVKTFRQLATDFELDFPEQREDLV